MQPTYNYGTATEASSEKVFLTMLESKFVECNKFMISSHLVAGIHKIQKGPVEKHPCSKRTDFACGSGPTTFLVNTAGRGSQSNHRSVPHPEAPGSGDGPGAHVTTQTDSSCMSRFWTMTVLTKRNRKLPPKLVRTENSFRTMKFQNIHAALPLS